MSNKNIKILSINQAIKEIINDFCLYNTQNHLFAKVYESLNKGITKSGSKRMKLWHGDYERVEGIFYKKNNHSKEIFIECNDFSNNLSDCLLKKQYESKKIADIYTIVFFVNAYPLYNDINNSDICIETEMEKFKCIQCGHCCLKFSDAYQNSVEENDYERWVAEKRQDILKYIYNGCELWVSPITGDYVYRCPWLRKMPKKKIYKCRIQNTKPKLCREYPKSKKHALQTGCKGFSK